MKTLSKTLLASALVAAGITGMNAAHAVEWSLNGELAVELTDTESDEDLVLDVTTTDLVLTISEKFGEVDVEGFIAYELDGDGDGLASDGAGITVSGAFGSLFVGDDGTGVFAGDLTDVMYNNSEIYYTDDTTNVIDYGLPLPESFSFNIFAGFEDFDVADDPDVAGDQSETDEENIDFFGVYGSYAVSGLTFAFGYTSAEESTRVGPGYDDILDLAVGYEGGPIAAGLGFQDVDGADDEVVSAFLSYTTGPVAITGYVEDAGDVGDVVALNVAYSFTDNFYTFFETAAYDDDEADNSEIGLVLTF